MSDMEEAIRLRLKSARSLKDVFSKRFKAVTEESSIEEKESDSSISENEIKAIENSWSELSNGRRKRNND